MARSGEVAALLRATSDVDGVDDSEWRASGLQGAHKHMEQGQAVCAETHVGSPSERRRLVGQPWAPASDARRFAGAVELQGESGVV